MQKLVAITACPTGIAHTYMAAEALEKAAKELGVIIHIETQGAIGADNVLTENDIKEADAVIIAAGKKVSRDRFAGKKVIEVPVENALKDGKAVIQMALNAKEDSIYELAQQHKEKQQAQKVGVYKHLMTGVNYMIPLVVAGGILIALSFAFGIHAGDPKDPSYNPIAQALGNIGGDAAFGLMIPVLAAGIAYSIADKGAIAAGLAAGMLAKMTGAGFLGGIIGGLLAGYITAFVIKHVQVPKVLENLKPILIVPLLSVSIVGFLMIFIIGVPIKAALDWLTLWLNTLQGVNATLLGLIIGLMMAFDMGGPVNKAISTFSIGLMSAGVYAPIAACMIAGMTPPLGLALATVLFKKKFTGEEREAGKAAWVLGASYITEGAIPFAVADPFRVIPSIMCGSAVAGAISMAFNVTSKAPHGGIWIFPIPNVIGNLGAYAAAIVAGTIVTALVVGFMKRKNNYE